METQSKWKKARNERKPKECPQKSGHDTTLNQNDEKFQKRRLFCKD